MIHILYEIRETPWGGGNQSLKALRAELRLRGVYAERLADADAVVFNSHHHVRAVLNARRVLPQAVFIHRIDGPIRLVRGSSGETDRLVYAVSASCADAQVFQSEWSRERNLEHGIQPAPEIRTVHNAADPAHFHPDPAFSAPADRVRIIATSWSSNARKGFDDYAWLDQHLDFDRVEMTFVGNSPVRFRNIRMLPPVASNKLGDLLRTHHIYLTASRSDPASNSLVEALSCGLPAIGYHDGGHPELIGSGGETYACVEEVPQLVDRMTADWSGYRGRIRVNRVTEIADAYEELAGSASRRRANWLARQRVRTALLEVKTRRILRERTR